LGAQDAKSGSKLALNISAATIEPRNAMCASRTLTAGDLKKG
jgi:hypothetical protein